ncbi:MAG TPA: MFS transporter [Beijerinckiaceae bacterium]|nr:MFS transporter [Beijerinckiaceae bacterium]
MPTTLRNVVPTLIALLIGYGLMQMGNTLQGTLLSVRGGLEGFSAAEIGAVGAGFWIGTVIGSLRSGRLIRRVGHIRTFAALGAIASTAALLHLLVVDPLVWVLARGMTGFCFAGLFMVVESWVNGAATPQTRGQILSIYGMTGLLAGVGGQLLLPTADPAQFQPFCIVASIIAFALVPIALTRAAAPREPEDVQISLRRLYRQSPFGVVAAFLCGVSTSTFFSLAPLWAQRRGFDDQAIALFMASGTLGGFLMTWPLGWLSDRIDRRAVIIGAAITAATMLLALVATVPRDAPPWVIYLCVAVFGGTIIPTYSIVIAHVNDTVTPREFVAAAGGLLIVQGAGATLGPLIGGLAMSLLARGLSITIITAQLLIALWGAYRFARRPLTRGAARADFVVEPPVPVHAR